MLRSTIFIDIGFQKPTTSPPQAEVVIAMGDCHMRHTPFLACRRGFPMYPGRRVFRFDHRGVFLEYEAAQEEEEARAAAGNESSEEGDGAKTTEIDDAWRTMAKELMVERSRACADAARSATIAAGIAVDAARSLWILAGMAVDAEHKETAYSSYVLAEQAKKKADECEKQAAEFVAFARRLDPMFY